jgi:hypothetical protein
MPRDLLRELARLVRSADADCLNVADFVVDNAAELAPLLHTTEVDLRNTAGQADDVVARVVRGRLQLALEEQREQRRDAAAATARNAAVEIGRTARWHERGVVLDEGLVLGNLLADPRTKHIAFMLPFITVVIEVEVLRRARLLQRTYIDLACFIDSDGLHFRWKAGRGQLNLMSRKVAPAATRAALEVPIPPPVQHQVPTFAGAVGELAAAQ